MKTAMKVMLAMIILASFAATLGFAFDRVVLFENFTNSN